MRCDRRGFLLGAGAFLAAGARPARAGASRILGGPAFGSYWRAVLPEGGDAAAAGAAIAAVVRSVDAAMSPYRADSEIGRFNRDPLPGPKAVSAPTRAVVAQALAIARLTGGAFDPTIGPLVARYGFGPVSGIAGGLDTLEVLPDAVEKSAGGTTLDLCGIAKGHALDRAAAALAALGIADALVEMGGEIHAAGRHPEGRAWQVAVEAPGSDGPLKVQRIVTLADERMASSGIAPNGFREGGRNTTHIIDPRSGRPLAGRLAVVSVIAPSGATADALATALMVLGEEEGMALAEREGIAVLFLVTDGPGLREVMTDRFRARILA